MKKFLEKINFKKNNPLNDQLIDLYYGKYQGAEVEYATVKDFVDSRRILPQICGLNGDLKNVQRAWMIKAILGSVPKHAKLLEIGAGEPIVASILSELGYDVTIVDPYDGSGNGPLDFDHYVKKYPDVKIIRGYFDEKLIQLKPNSFDAIYSISVLEHVPAEKAMELTRQTFSFLKKGGRNIHAIDHVFLGAGQQFHEEQLDRYFKGFKLNVSYKTILEQLKDDVETYFLSAEGHLFWMGNTTYHDFPFRRVVSININALNKSE